MKTNETSLLESAKEVLKAWDTAEKAPQGFDSEARRNYWTAMFAAMDNLSQQLKKATQSKWHQADELPERFQYTGESKIVLAMAETSDGGLQITPAKVIAMSKVEWREVRFDHEGLGRQLVVRWWTDMPAFP